MYSDRHRSKISVGHWRRYWFVYLIEREEENFGFSRPERRRLCMCLSEKSRNLTFRSNLPLGAPSFVIRLEWVCDKIGTFGKDSCGFFIKELIDLVNRIFQKGQKQVNGSGKTVITWYKCGSDDLVRGCYRHLLWLSPKKMLMTKSRWIWSSRDIWKIVSVKRNYSLGLLNKFRVGRLPVENATGQ